jgi:ADP-heptose:LPS heptosyltransferase
VKKIIKRGMKQVELAIRGLTLGLLSRRSAPSSEHSLPLLLPSEPRILFLRQDRIGDAVVTTPLLVAVKQKYPHARITMLLGDNNRAIRPLLPIDCDTVVYAKSLLRDLRMLRSLRKQRFDVAIDLTDNASVTSSMLMAMIKPRFAIGIEKENRSVYNVIVPRIDRLENHISSRIAELLRPLGIDPSAIDLKPILRVDRQNGLPGRLGLNISAGTESRWAPERVYAAIAQSALESGAWSEIRVYCEPRDTDKATSIVSMADDPRVTLQPPTRSYGEFASALSSCEALITPDTSVVHLAAALDIPQVVIFAPIPEGLHYWTPIGVPYEMLVQHPNLSTLEPQTVIALLRKLEARLTATAMSQSSQTHAH